MRLVGFAKVGHPGIMYAEGQRDQLLDWLREVKSWQWLALRVRIAVEPLEHCAENTERHGEWTEYEKISDSLEWLRMRGRENVLLDIGMGGSSVR